jgi:site-specific DNA-cytosine methylase
LKKNRFNQFHFPQPIPLEIGVDDILERGVAKTELTQHKMKIITDLVQNKKIDSTNKPWVVNLNCSSFKRSSPMLNISPCLMASGAIYYVTSVKRNLTPTEFLALQGFHRFDLHDEYSKIYGMAGNSMSVSVIAFIIAEMIKAKI